MTLKYERKVLVTFGPREGPLREVTDLRIKFKISKSLRKKPNSAVIEIFNLSETSRNSINTNDAIIQVVAGYESLTKGIWFGDITRSTNVRQSVDRITKIESGDGEKDMAETTVSKSFAPGTKVRTIVEQVIKAFPNLNFSQKLTQAIPDTAELITGGSFEGSASDVLENLLEGVGLNFSVQDGDIQISGDDSLAQQSVVVVNVDSGLIESPALTTQGVAFRMLLEPRLVPGNIIELESESVTGSYVAQQVVHDGDTWSQNWYTQVEAIPNEQ